MRLRALRKEKGITQEELAQKMGVSRSTVAMWETNKNEPDNAMLLNLSMFFNCSVDYLLEKSNDRIDDNLLDIVNVIPREQLEAAGNIYDVLKIVLTDEERELLFAYRVADVRAQQDALRMLLEHPKKAKKESFA